MQQKVEGLVISKRPYQERHLLCHLLLRSGKKISVIFLGGRGGGKNQKGSNVELGNMLSLLLVRSSGQVELHKAKEWTVTWSPLFIRDNHEAFYLTCFIFEVVSLISVQDNLHDSNNDFDDTHIGLFRLVSNALFRLNSKIESKSFVVHEERSLFLAKLLIETGLYPQMSECANCGQPLSSHKSVQLSPSHGGFSCQQCIQLETGEREISEQGLQIWNLLKQVANEKYGDIKIQNTLNNEGARALLNYFCFQCQVDLKSIKTLTMMNQQ